MQKRWTIKEIQNTDKVQELASDLGIDTILSTLLLHRGVNTFE